MTLGLETRRSRSSSRSRAQSLSASFKSIFKTGSSKKSDDENEQEHPAQNSQESHSKVSSPRVSSTGTSAKDEQPKVLSKIATSKEAELMNSRSNSRRKEPATPLMSPKISSSTQGQAFTRKGGKFSLSPSRAMSITSQESYVSDEDDDMMEKVAFPQPKGFYEGDVDPTALDTLPEEVPRLSSRERLEQGQRGRDRGRRSRASSINTAGLVEELDGMSIDTMLESEKKPRRASSTKAYPPRHGKGGIDAFPQASRSPPNRHNTVSYSHRSGMKTVPALSHTTGASGGSGSTGLSRHNSTGKSKYTASSTSGKSNSLRKVESASSVSTMSTRDSKTRHSMRGRQHADTVSASNLQPNYRNASCFHFPSDDAKCILQVDNFRVFENGTHEHNLKTISLVHSNNEEGPLSKTKGSVFSFSGFFKGHGKPHDESTPNVSEKEEDHFSKFKNAVSLIPQHAGHTTDVRTRSNPDSESDDSNSSLDSKKKTKKKSLPQVVNQRAAVSSDELELINTLSAKILGGLSGKSKTKVKDVEDPMAPPIFCNLYGKSIGTIGQGAYGVVSVCSRPLSLRDSPPFPTFVKESKMYFAVKELKPRPSDQVEKFSTKITSEFIIGHSLSQKNKSTGRAPPNILKVIDLMESDTTFIEVMEFCPSGDLYSLLTRKSKNGTSLHPLEADCFMKQLLNGVKYMHDHGVAHCDLKPENILFQPDGLLKICDFGTSCVFQTAWERHVHFQSGAMGSEPYVAPEEFVQDNEYDPRLVDLWSCGVVYCTMVLGHYLWKIASPGNDAMYDTFLEEMEEDEQFYLFEELRHVNHELTKARKIALYKVFQVNPERRISVDQLLASSWMKRTRCCISYKKGV